MICSKFWFYMIIIKVPIFIVMDTQMVLIPFIIVPSLFSIVIGFHFDKMPLRFRYGDLKRKYENE